MASISDITVTPLSGLNHIDALLDKGPDWNFLTPNPYGNTLYYTFSISSGNEAGRSGQEMFSVSQQAATRSAFDYLHQVTGIVFEETGDGALAQIHLANLDIEGAYTTGLASWRAGYSGSSNLTSYSVNAYLYLDNAEYRGMTQNLTPGGNGYETLLHELGHVLGLKHPFHEDDGGAQIVLSPNEDHTGNTLMSYTSDGRAHSTYSPYDIAALNWLYGGDGLRGALGINSSTGGRYITGTDKADTLTGTAFNDTLQGNGGNDMIDGGSGRDTAVFNANRSAYSLSDLGNGALAVSHATQGTTTLRNIDVLQFADMSVERANLADMLAPVKPALSLTLNAKDYARGNMPTMTGAAEPNSTVRVYIDNQLVATVKTGADGLWGAQSSIALKDGLGYRAYVTATDDAGNVSAPSDTVIFNVDATAPVAPSVTFGLNPGSNQPIFAGTGEAGSTIELYRDGDFITIGKAEVRADGTWQLNSKPLPNGVYKVIGASVDVAGNATSAARNIDFTVDNPLNKVGTSGADTFTMTADNVAISGGAGIDIAVFQGARADYTIAQQSWGHAVTDRSGGVDGLYNVERLQFSDGWVAIDETAASVFRLYQAALGREAEPFGLGYWIDRVDKGASLQQIAHEFTWAPEFKEKYGENPTDEIFLDRLYQNVLNRAPDPDGYAYWLTRVDDSSREQIMLEFSDSVENKAQVLASTSDGMEFIPYVYKPQVAIDIVGVAPAAAELPFGTA